MAVRNSSAEMVSAVAFDGAPSHNDANAQRQQRPSGSLCGECYRYIVGRYVSVAAASVKAGGAARRGVLIRAGHKAGRHPVS